ncbi:SGNH hydrolase-type esterase domain containing protein [Trema orientale]|uniref:SGNH hydrolase-type esterase domain containing protein n=1 Tax=Trema orientale TaxID=63057 RepID=A0A2P5EM41_TREOI|nr:SGNH hydrolase-type esterase domain containing protein [Trema orientale]
MSFYRCHHLLFLGFFIFFATLSHRISVHTRCFRLWGFQRWDHPPYSRDFPTHTTTLTDADLITGVSFALGGSGLDEATTAVNGVLSMEQQLRNLDEAIRRMEKSTGKNRTEDLLREAIVRLPTTLTCYSIGLALSFRSPTSRMPTIANVDSEHNVKSSHATTLMCEPTEYRLTSL